jgi:hypothetical protein
MFDYTRQFDTLTQYGSYHVDTDEKKANVYRERLTIHLQERLGQFTSLSYNEMVSAAIDQERLMKAVTEADEKKRKTILDPLSVVVLAVLLISTAQCIPHLEICCTDLNSSRIGAITHNTSNVSSSRNNNSSTVLLPYHTADCHQAPTVVSC